MISNDISSIKVKSIYIVIPVYNRKTYTLGCLKSLKNQTVTGFHVIVVDDGSTDGTEDAIRFEFPDVAVLKGDGNLWWSGAMNMGVEHALNLGAKYIISLNDDLEVSQDYIEKMIFWAEQKPNALFGSYVFDIETKQPSEGGSRISWRKCKVIHLLDILPETKRKGIHKVTDAPGRGLWIPSEVFRTIGMFDARFLPHYGADNDFTLRATRYGFEIYCNFDAVLYSYVEHSKHREYKDNYSIGNYLRHLFGIKSMRNIKNFTIIAFRHCPKRYLLYYWLYGVAKQIGGYITMWGYHTLRNSLMK